MSTSKRGHHRAIAIHHHPKSYITDDTASLLEVKRGEERMNRIEERQKRGIVGLGWGQ